MGRKKKKTAAAVKVDDVVFHGYGLLDEEMEDAICDEFESDSRNVQTSDLRAVGSSTENSVSAEPCQSGPRAVIMGERSQYPSHDVEAAKFDEPPNGDAAAQAEHANGARGT